MLSKPDAGWTDFSLGSKSYALSYLNDIPIEWLDQAIHGLKTLEPFAVHGFCEPGRMLCLVSYWNCHIIFEDDEREALQPHETAWEYAHISMLEFCKLLYSDIASNLDEWSEWVNIFADSEREYYKIKEKRKQQIQMKLTLLDALIKENEKAFDDHHCFL